MRWNRGYCWIVFALVFVLSACAEPAAQPQQEPVQADTSEESRLSRSIAGQELADVVSVAATGDRGAYRFAVAIESPDEGCDQYADWWEVISEQGELLYRRILAHSHVTEQPFERSGGPVAIEPETRVIVRAHMHPSGYGGVTFRGSVESGFEAADLPADFASSLALQPPLPQGCDG